jgi:hypothetical protein
MTLLYKSYDFFIFCADINSFSFIDRICISFSISLQIGRLAVIPLFIQSNISKAFLKVEIK